MKKAAFPLTAGLLLSLAPAATGTTLYVDLSNPAPVAPYTNWVTAATNIQDAIDVAVDGDQVLVTNGVYQAGGREVYGMTNRVAVTRAVTVRSLSGPEVTVIKGYQVPGATNGAEAIRCAYLTNGAVLSGFTLTNGATQSSGGDKLVSGGGIWCEPVGTSAVVSNCVVIGNSARSRGGGVYYGTLDYCTLSGNSALSYGGGVSYGSLKNCTLTNNWASFGGGGFYGTLTQCTLSGNRASGDGGGGYYGTLVNCTLTGNSAGDNGGGASGATLNNCALSGNSAARSGGGAYSGTLNNCTLTGNSATFVGGVRGSTVRNSVVYYNIGREANYSGGSLNYCCTTPLPAGGVGNTNAEPQLASASHLSTGSPSRGAGSAAYATGLDIDSEPWANPPSIGCDEYWSGSVTGALSPVIVASCTNAAVGFSVDFQAVIGGRVTASSWDFGDGVVVSNRPCISHAWLTEGEYVVGLRAYNESYPDGVAASVTVRVVSQPVHYVALESSSPESPYSSWANAATNIQDAVDAATVFGALVLVTNGIYQAGARDVQGMSNRVAVTKPVTVQSVNGPAVTSIVGSAPFGPNAVRCVYLASGAVLAGFTVTNGATTFDSGNSYQLSGGGIWCEPKDVVVSNCVISGNSASSFGGGACAGALYNCTIISNTAILGGGAYGSALGNCTLGGNRALHNGGGAYDSTLADCTLSGNWAGRIGGGAYYGTLSNCTLAGNSADYGGGADSATLQNCTLTDNVASYGGGASSGTLGNCTLTGNSAYQGGGAFSATLNNCLLSENSATYGGGSYSDTLINCTLTLNSAKTQGGGAYGSTLRNCLVYYNTAPASTNYDSNSSLDYCCTTPLPTKGTNNLSADPQLAGAWRLSTNSPCRRAGNAALAKGVDIDGEAWGDPPSIGCDEYWPGTITGALSAAILASYTNVPLKFTIDFRALVEGRASALRWDFGDGVVVSNRPIISHTWAAAGTYTVSLRAYNETYPDGVADSVPIQVVDMHYASCSNVSPRWPFGSWATAATNIQDAVDAAAPGTLVLVSNGVYQVGARAVYGMNNRLAVAKPLTVRSVNGPGATSIVGGVGATRCVYLTNGVFFSGFTLTNGGTQTSGDIDRQQSGGGVWCESRDVVVSNCVLVGNSAYERGGGIYSGTVMDCTLSGNSAWEGGGSYGSTLNNSVLTSNSPMKSATRIGGGRGASHCSLTNCLLSGNSDGGAIASLLDHCTLSSNSCPSGFGGGSCGGVLNRCVLQGNSAYGGGGAYEGTLNNCVLRGNSAINEGGGASYATLNNCVLIGNSAMTPGGALYGTLNNCIVYYNSGGNYRSDGMLNYCCTTPLPQNGTGNFTNAPLFVDLAGGDLRLQTNSPCINAGLNAYAPGTLDLCGNPRISGGTADVGAYEFPSPTSRISYAWLQGYGFPTDGSADYLDPDLDGMNNWQEWVAGTDPTNTASVLSLTGPVVNPPALVLRWNSYAGYVYFVQRATNLAVPRFFTTLASNIPGLPYTTTYTDTNTFVSNTTAFYRVGASSSVPEAILLQKPLWIPVSVTLAWPSFTNRTYFLERATSLAPPATFSLLQSSIPGQADTTSFTDTNPPASGPAFYRLGVQP